MEFLEIMVMSHIINYYASQQCHTELHQYHHFPGMLMRVMRHEHMGILLHNVIV